MQLFALDVYLPAHGCLFNVFRQAYAPGRKRNAPFRRGYTACSVCKMPPSHVRHSLCSGMQQIPSRPVIRDSANGKCPGDSLRDVAKLARASAGSVLFCNANAQHPVIVYRRKFALLRFSFHIRYWYVPLHAPNATLTVLNSPFFSRKNNFVSLQVVMPRIRKRYFLTVIVSPAP